MTIFSIRAKKQAQTLLERFYGQFPKIIDFQWNFTMGRLSLIALLLGRWFHLNLIYFSCKMDHVYRIDKDNGLEKIRWTYTINDYIASII